MITNYSDPIVTLNQEYRQSDVGITPQLGAYIIGPSYYIWNHQTVQDAQQLRIKSDVAFKEGGATCAFPAALEGYEGSIYKESIKLFVKSAKVKVGEVTAATIVTSGEALNITEEIATSIKEGALVSIEYTDKEGIEDTLQTTIYKVVIDADTKASFFYLQQSLQSVKTITKATFYVFQDVYAKTGFSIVNTTDSTSVLNKKWLDRDADSLGIKFSGVLKTAKDKVIEAGDVFVEYKAQNDAFLYTPGSISNDRYVQELLGPITVQNPLALAVAAALSQSDGRTVYFKSIDSSMIEDTQDEIEAYSQAIDLVSNLDSHYGIVPCTSKAQVLRDILDVAKQKAEQEVPVLKYVYASVDIPKDNLYPLLSVIGNKTNRFTISEIDTKTNTIVVTEALVYYQGIKKDDVVRKGDTNYTIAKSNATTKTLQLNSVEGLSVGDQIQIMHLVANKSLKANADHVKHLISSKVFSDSRGSIVFADGATFKGIEVPNYVVAAALAGMRSSTYSHAPLSNVKFNAITTEDKHGFTKDQLNDLGANGFWRVGLNTDGQTISRRQLTSAASNDVNKDQQSIVCNVDSICMSLKSVGKNLVGNTNITPVLLDILQTTIKNKLDSFTRYSDTYIGPQLLQATLVSIKQDAVYKDRIYAQMQGQPPKPFNRFHMKFYIN